MVNKKVLIIAYYFPPTGGAGVLRPLKLAKYLPNYGWDPVILTVKPFAYHARDETLLNEVNYPVMRSESYDPARFLYIMGKRKSKAGVVNWIRRLFNLPDTRGGWLPPGISNGIKLAGGCSAIISTAPPFTSHLIGLVISRYHSIPLLVDFRDVWIDFPYLPYYSWQLPVIKYLQRLVLNHARWITTAFDEINTSFPEVYHKKTTVIYNGYDPEDIIKADPAPIFTITHMGSITPRRNIDPLINILGDLSQKNNKFRLRLVGYIHPQEKKKITDRIKNVEVCGYLNHQIALEKLAESHLLVLLNSRYDSISPGRQAEYAASRLPIVVVGHGKSCPVLKILAKQDYPVSFIGYDDRQSLKEIIVKFRDMWQARQLVRFDGDLGFLDRKIQAKTFSRILDKITSKKR